MTSPAINAAGLDELEALLAKATPGEWHVMTGAIGVNPWISAGGGEKPDGKFRRSGCILNMVAHDEREEDAALIAALHNAAPALITLARQALPEPVGEMTGLTGDDIEAIGELCADGSNDEIARFLNARLTPATDALAAVREETIEACAKVADDLAILAAAEKGGLHPLTVDTNEGWRRVEDAALDIAEGIRALGQAK